MNLLLRALHFCGLPRSPSLTLDYDFDVLMGLAFQDEDIISIVAMSFCARFALNGIVAVIALLPSRAPLPRARRT